MRTRTAITALGATALLVLTGCDDTTRPGDSAPERPRTTQGPAADAGPAKPGTAELPSFVGMGLQSAQDKAQELGFHSLTSHDALGRGRNQISDRNWKVCNQTPQPGGHPTDTRIDFGTVKLRETCPAKDSGRDTATPAADDKMPDFRGKSVKVARQSLDTSTGLTVEDASPDGRMVLVESNWQVCTQDPAPGTPLNGRPVALTAVKFEETCP
ncbi:PASTA domain-containing protein [Streptomyces sp. TRM64462]|uniref:PASTA domain-containing protein n=1 Tax=Streptomyces sp. TRM64462 TaxID=2741726 RepID=UPI001586A532|nr:PASTA domain-containing protein [Streptomyces sp. TRM64462]